MVGNSLQLDALFVYFTFKSTEKANRKTLTFQNTGYLVSYVKMKYWEVNFTKIIETASGIGKGINYLAQWPAKAVKHLFPNLPGLWTVRLIDVGQAGFM